jgi:hypothetical protein
MLWSCRRRVPVSVKRIASTEVPSTSTHIVENPWSYELEAAVEAVLSAEGQEDPVGALFSISFLTNSAVRGRK